MKGKLGLLIITLCLLLCGCSIWMDGQYYSVTPHLEENAPQNQESVGVSNYSELRMAVTERVESGITEAVFYFTDTDSSMLENYMRNVINSVKYYHPVGAYAVDEITYEIGTSGGYPAVSVQISYIHGRAEILRIKEVRNMDMAMSAIADALTGFDGNAVIMVDTYQELDFAQWVQDYVSANPQSCMEQPQVSYAVYPSSGAQRVIELTFTYQTSRETLRNMQSYVSPVFTAAFLNVREVMDEGKRFSIMYSFLMERTEYQFETSITPAYSLLRYGVGDSKAFAQVYTAMCGRSGMECLTVSGTRDGEPWTWNMICMDGVYYHVDLIQSNSLGRLHLLTPEELKSYVWDYSEFPETEIPEETVPTEAQEG